MGDNSAQYAQQDQAELYGKVQGEVPVQAQRATAGAVVQKQTEQQVQEASLAQTPDGTRRRAPVRESRIKNRPASEPAANAAIRIQIQLDLEVEVDLYARVRGDVTIGLM